LKKILIIGGTGFIGFHLAIKALKKKWLVTSVSTNYPKSSRKLNGVKYLKVDISKKKNIKKIHGEFDYIVNLGGYVDHSKQKKTYRSHYLGSKYLADFFLKKKIKKFIQVGSSLEYGKLKSPQYENFALKTEKLDSIYAKSKLLATNYIINLYKKYKFPCTVIRLFLVYGENQDINRLIPFVIKKCLCNKNFNTSNGNQMRDFLHINDCINAIIKILQSSKANGEIINIGYGKATKVKTIINFIKKKIGKGIPNFGTIPLRKDENKKMYPSIKKVKKIINWKPKIKIKIGLYRTIKYMKQNN